MADWLKHRVPWGTHQSVHVFWCQLTWCVLVFTAAFNDADHGILISYLEHYVGIRGTALEVFRSHLCGRTFSLSLGDAVLSPGPLHCGVPQDLIFRSIKFSLVFFHCYAEDMQIYLPVKQNNTISLKPLFDCPKGHQILDSLELFKLWSQNWSPDISSQCCLWCFLFGLGLPGRIFKI